MSDPLTPNILLAVPIRGSDSGVWDVPVNWDFTAVDGFTGGIQTISVASTPVTLTAPAGVVTPTPGPTQAQNAALRFTGALIANVQITLPLPGYMIISNATTGNYVLTFRAAGAGQVIAVAQGSTRHVYNDGTNVAFVNLPDVGTYELYAGATVPSWVTACTVPPFLNCDGSTFSAVTYPYLNTILGGNTLPDLRGRYMAALNQTTGRITTAGGGVDGDTRFASGGAQNRSIIQTNFPNIGLSINVSTNGPGGLLRAFGNPTYVAVASAAPPLGFFGLNFNSGPQSGGPNDTMSGTLQLNGGVTQVPLQTLPPTGVFGIVMIRAG